MPFDQQEFEVLRAAEGPSGGPLPAHNRSGDDPVLRHLSAGRDIIATRFCRNSVRVGALVCSWGALREVNGDEWYCDAETYLNRSALEILSLPAGDLDKDNWYIQVNDNKPHDVVVSMWDRAIAARKSELDPSRTL